jgi:hypothetical protein
MSSNPYQAPITTELAMATAIADDDFNSPNPLKIFFKWLVVCVICAGPSFFWGCLISKAQWQQILAMTLGILLFIGAYTATECTPYFQRLMRDRRLRRTLKIGFGTRIGISLLFPFGIYLDLFVGFLSVSITESLFPNSLGLDDSQTSMFLAFFGTTILQGLLLNAMLLVYMVFVYGIVRAVSRPSLPPTKWND